MPEDALAAWLTLLILLASWAVFLWVAYLTQTTKSD